MSVIPTKPGDRMAASAWESKKSEQDAGAGNTFAALFGAAWTQQMQQTRASQDQRMVADTGGSPVADVSRRNEDAMMREQSGKLSSGVRNDNRPASERSAQADEQTENASAGKNESASQQGHDAQQRGDVTARKRDAENPNSDAAIAKRLARQQRPGTQSGQSSQAAAIQNRQAIDARASGAVGAEDAGDSAVSAAGAKTKKSAHATGSDASQDADTRFAKADNDALQTQRTLSAKDATADAAAQADTKNALTAATSSDAAVDAAMDAALKANGKTMATASATAGESDDLLATSRRSTGSPAAASFDVSAQTAMTTAASNASANSAANTAALQQGDADTIANARPGIEGLSDSNAAVSGKNQDAASRLIAAGDASAALNQIKGAAGNPTNSATIGTDALRQRSADAALAQGKIIDPRDVAQNPALSSQAARAGTDNGVNPGANSGASNAANSVANNITNNSVLSANVSANASTLSTNNAADATRKLDESKPAAGGRNRGVAGLAATGSANNAGLIASAAGTPTDTRIAIEQAAAANTSNAANTAAGGQTGTALPAQTAASLSAQNSTQASAQSSSESASDSTTSASGTALQNNGSLFSAAAVDGLNAFQRIAAQDDAPRLVMSTPITDPGFADELYDTVKLVSTRGLQSVEINIAPAELGPIKLRVDMNGNEADVRFEAANETTRSLLADAVPALKEQLSQSGIDLRHATVDRNAAWNGNSQGNNQGNLQGNLGQGAGQSGSQNNNTGNNSGGQPSGNGRFDNSAGNLRADAGAQQPGQRLRNALLDTYA